MELSANKPVIKDNRKFTLCAPFSNKLKHAKIMMTRASGAMVESKSWIWSSQLDLVLFALHQ